VRIVLGALAAVLAGLALFEVTMQPTGPERTELGVIFIVMAATSAIAALFLPMLARKARRLMVTLFALSLISFIVAAIGLAATASRMFFSDHDLRLLMVVLGFGLVAALTFALTASRSLTEDLRRMASTASAIAWGGLDARTGVDRADEVGRLADAIDRMAANLEEAAQRRAVDDEARRRFLAAVGHDLRTPLASLQAAMEAVGDGVAPDPDRYLSSMRRDLAALNALVDDLFLLARIESGAVPIVRVPIDLNELADEAMEVLRPMAGQHGVELRLDSDGPAVVPAGPEAMSRVLRNLLDNAIRHAPAGTTVRITVGNGEAVTVCVSDEGPGFTAEFVEHAFDTFTRSDPARGRDTGGAGLGLAIARGFVNAFGGEIWADPGPGGRVSFRIPR
jgi:two-component system sensor histidine kinase BaeS